MTSGGDKIIIEVAGLLDNYNNSGDDEAIVDGDGYGFKPADPRTARE